MAQATQLLDASHADVQCAVDALPRDAPSAGAAALSMAADGIARADARAEDISRMARQLLQLLRAQARAAQGAAAAGAAGAQAAGASEEELARVPQLACEPGCAAAGEACAICLSEMVVGDALSRMPACGHHYHRACLDEWLRVRAVCPLCNRSLRCDAAAAAAKAPASGSDSGGV